jgi:uncharacterized membrane protein
MTSNAINTNHQTETQLARKGDSVFTTQRSTGSVVVDANQAHTSIHTTLRVNSVVAVFDTHEQAEDAVRKLQRAGIDMKSLSIAGRNAHVEEHVVGYYNTGDRMSYWGKRGAFWGALWGLLFDSALFAIPGIGPVLLAGPLVSWMIAVLEGAIVFGGVSAIGAGLMSVGIPRDSAIQYETALKTDKYLLIVHATPSVVAKAESVIQGTRLNCYTVHGENVPIR